MRNLEPQSETKQHSAYFKTMVWYCRLCSLLINRMTRRSIKVRSGVGHDNDDDNDGGPSMLR